MSEHEQPPVTESTTLSNQAEAISEQVIPMNQPPDGAELEEGEEGDTGGIPLTDDSQVDYDHEDDEYDDDDECSDEEGESLLEDVSFRSHDTLIYKDEAYRFCVVRDPGINEAFAFRDDPPKVYEDDGQEIFKDAMRNDNLMLIRSFYDGLKKKKIDLQFARLDPRAMLPMSLALARNKTVTEINLRGNHLTTDAAFHLAEILATNKCIKSLSLSRCKLGSEGICKLGDALELSTTLEFLDLSHNELGDAGLECLVTGIGYNTSIKHLNLSANKLNHLSTPHLTDMFVINSSVTTLDLSWNDIVQESGLRKMLFSIGKLNETIENFIMQWNGLGGANTASYFKVFLNRHKYIQELDISHNRFRGDEVMDIFAKGINSSETLLTFDLSFNPLTIENVGHLVKRISPNATLKRINLIDLWIHQEDYEAVQDVRHGSLLIDVEGKRGITRDAIKDITIQELILKRCHYLGLKPKKKAKRKEFGHFLLRMEEEGKLKPMKKSAFEEIVEKEGLLLEAGLFVELTKWFKAEKKGRVDLVLIKEMYQRLFPEVVLPKSKKKGHVASVQLPTENDVTLVVNGILDELIASTIMMDLEKAGNLESVLLALAASGIAGETFDPTDAENLLGPLVDVAQPEIIETEDETIGEETEDETIGEETEDETIGEENEDETIGEENENGEMNQEEKKSKPSITIKGSDGNAKKPSIAIKGSDGSAKKPSITIKGSDGSAKKPSITIKGSDGSAKKRESVKSANDVTKERSSSQTGSKEQI